MQRRQERFRERFREIHGYDFGYKRFPEGPSLKKYHPIQIHKLLSQSAARALKQASKGCELCGWNEYPEALVIHHRDRNPRNNRLANLMVVCRNCHYLIHKRLKRDG